MDDEVDCVRRRRGDALADVRESLLPDPRVGHLQRVLTLDRRSEDVVSETVVTGVYWGFSQPDECQGCLRACDSDLMFVLLISEYLDAFSWLT